MTAAAYPRFILALSKSGIKADVYNPVLARHGVQSLALLAIPANQPLIPVIAAELGIA
jgi:hypothetical protein